MEHVRNLAAAYEKTLFEADTPDGRLELRIGEPNEDIKRVYEVFGVTSAAYTTVWHPGSRLRPVEESDVA